MREIWVLLLSILERIRVFIREAADVFSGGSSFRPVLAAIGDVGPQVYSVRYIREKRPCSATGGTA